MNNYKVKLFLVRHGQTFDNVNKIMQGQTQGELTPLGKEQAKMIAQKVESLSIDAFISSDLKRCSDMCKIIAGKRASEIVLTPLLRERDWGAFTGRYIPELKDEPFPPDVESIEALKQRCSFFIDFLKINYPNKTVLAVGHGITNRAIQAVVYQKEMYEIPRMENAEIREIYL